MEDSIEDYLEKKKEDSVIDIFRKRVEKIARRKGREVLTSPLNSQDRELGADFFITELTKFSIFEFKYQEGDIKSEKRKDLRRVLCEKLELDSIRQNQHKESHFIAWSTKEENPKVELNIYCHEVCNKAIFHHSNISEDLPIKNPRQKDIDFIEDFFNGKKGLKYKTFSSYINWLLEIAGVDSGRFELLFEHPSDDITHSVPIKSLSELRKWLLNNPPEPTVTSTMSP